MAITLDNTVLRFDPAVRVMTASQTLKFKKFSGMHRGSAQATIAMLDPFNPKSNLSSKVAIGSC